MTPTILLPENRASAFTALYTLNLQHGILPGLVYKYMPMMADHFGWSGEQKLWFAFLNGMTQNPITSLRMMQQLPEPTYDLDTFWEWFNTNWDNLQFDTDRRYGKKETLLAIQSYVKLLNDKYDWDIEAMWSPQMSYEQLWNNATAIHSFGRLSSFSYLEYVYIMGYGADCSDLMFNDKSGSKSHRNGMLFLLNQDKLVDDKRLDNGFNGYTEFDKMCDWLHLQAEKYLYWYTVNHPDTSKFAGNFTLESNLCTFKNHMFGRRYPAVYADMAYERILWHKERNIDVALFEDMYHTLPKELQYGDSKLKVSQRGKTLFDTGRVYRQELIEDMI